MRSTAKPLYKNQQVSSLITHMSVNLILENSLGLLPPTENISYPSVPCGIIVLITSTDGLKSPLERIPQRDRRT